MIMTVMQGAANARAVDGFFAFSMCRKQENK